MLRIYGLKIYYAIDIPSLSFPRVCGREKLEERLVVLFVWTPANRAYLPNFRIDPGLVRADEFIVAEEAILISVIKRCNWPFSCVFSYSLGYFHRSPVFIGPFYTRCFNKAGARRAGATASYLLAGPFHLALNIDFMGGRERFTGVRGNTNGINGINVSKRAPCPNFMYIPGLDMIYRESDYRSGLAIYSSTIRSKIANLFVISAALRAARSDAWQVSSHSLILARVYFW